MQKKITFGVLFLAVSAILFTSCNNQTTNSSSSSSISTSLPSSSSSSSSIPSSSSIKNEISISVSGPKAVRYGNTIELTVNVTGTENKTVIWKKSSDLISISNNIVSVTRQVEEDTEVTITVQPVADLSKEYSFVITVLAPEPDPVLTQDMLDVLKTDKIEFNGTTTIDLYSIASDKYYSSTIVESYTNMKDNFWSAAYANSTTGKTEYLIYENYQGNACQVGLSLMNEESYTPITDDNGLPVKWEDANLYNPLISLSVENFTYNKESGLFDYNGTNEKLLSQLSTSCTPYEFDAVKFSLRVEYNQITSIVLVTGEDYRVQTGYKAIQTLEAYFNTGDLVKYPYINKYTLEEEHKKYAFITVAMGKGITNIFKDLGVDYVIEGGQTMNPSTQDMMECISKLNADHIFILPNNKNIIMAATQAAEISDKDVRVIPTKSIPQGITCITMFNSEHEVDENEAALMEALELGKTGSVTYAVRDTEMDGIEIKEGNMLGLIEGKINKVGDDYFTVAEGILESMVDEDSELITIFYGKDVDENKIEEFTEKLEEKYEDCDIQMYKGDQPLYYFIMAVE